MITIRLPVATLSVLLNNDQLLVLIFGNFFFVSIKKASDLFAILGMPFVNVFLRRLVDLRHSQRLPVDIEKLSVQKNRIQVKEPQKEKEECFFDNEKR